MLSDLVKFGFLEVSTISCCKCHDHIKYYSETPIYRGIWGKGNIHGKSGFAVNRGFVCLHYMDNVKENLGRRRWPWYIGVCGKSKSGRGKSGFYCISISV